MKNLKALIYLGLFGLALGGCGLEEDPDDDDSDSPGADITLQSPYLPMTAGTQWQYQDTTSGNITANIAAASGFSNDVGIAYSVELDSSDPVTFYFTSTPQQIYLQGLNGPFNFSVGSAFYSVDQLRFNEPLALLGAPQDQSTLATATVTRGASFDISSELEIRVSYSATETSNQIDSIGLGLLPSQRIELDAEVSIFSTQTTPAVLLTTQNVGMNFEFTSGLGMVALQGNTINNSVDSILQQVTNLPLPIRFEYNSGTPIPVSSSTTLATDGGNITASDYTVANQSIFDSLDWVDVVEDTASDTFYVEMQNSATLPTTLTAVQVLLQHKETGERLSTSVILQP